MPEDRLASRAEAEAKADQHAPYNRSDPFIRNADKFSRSAQAAFCFVVYVCFD